MTYGPYTPFEKEKFILRDRLAMDRTTLANERTLLAYLRTSLTLIIVAVSFLQFVATLFTDIVGWVMIPVAIIIAVIGIVRYTQRQRMIGRFKAISPSTQTPEEAKEPPQEQAASDDGPSTDD